MAGGKETPRQKMIGMMYLVLTALLALQVSKEIINAFVAIEHTTKDSTAITEGKNGEIYAFFADPKLQSENEKAKKFSVIVDDIHTKSDAMVQYINELKLDLAANMEGKDKRSSFAEPADVNGITAVKPTEEILQSLTDYDAPTNLFIGSEKNKPKGKGPELKTKFHEFRNSLVEILASAGGKLEVGSAHDPKDLNLSQVNINDTSIVTRLFKSLTRHDESDEHGSTKKVPWESAKFYHAPAAAAMATLSGLQSEIRNVESEAISHLKAKVKGATYTFDGFKALAIAPSKTINKDSDDTLQVYLAAYNSKTPLDVAYKYNDAGNSKAKPTPGFVNIPIPSGTTGANKLSGEILVKNNTTGKVDPLPWNFTYSVSKPVGVVSATDLNVLYVGYDNHIEATASGYTDDDIDVKCAGCSLRKKKGGYIAKVTKGKKATVSIRVKETGDVLVKQDFRIFPLPTPKPFFAGQTFDKSSIKLGSLRQGKKLIAKFENSPLNVKFTVTGFNMVIVKNGKEVTLRAKNGSLTGAMLGALKKFKKNQRVYFENITAKSPGNKPRKLPPLSFRII